MLSSSSFFSPGAAAAITGGGESDAFVKSRTSEALVLLELGSSGNKVSHVCLLIRVTMKSGVGPLLLCC